MNQARQDMELASGHTANPADYPLPALIKRRPAGLFVDLTALGSNALFHEFLDRLFTSGCRLVGGDYELIQKVLYALDAKEIWSWADRLAGLGRSPEVLLAKNISAFSDERRLLYRGWRLDPKFGAAQYFFEPIHVERVIEEPVFGSVPQADGQLPIVRHERRTISEHLPLDVDEFFASAWLNNVRFGWDVASVRAEIAKDVAGSRVTAKVQVSAALAPTAGEDATLREEAQTIHRSDAPKIRGDGRIDLTQFKNRFPQVGKNSRLLKKIPCKPGVAGFNVAGQALPPEAPKDFSLDHLAGPGTRIDRLAQGEFIVATIDGFLSVNADTSQISVAEKIINREGVSVRTTGNLSLQGDEYEEHGEVQEQRTVEGLNMTFMADVFGNIVSRGGRIVINQHLAGGSAKSPGGVVDIKGGASRAVIDARDGEVRVKYAENTTIIARKVFVERACLCDIVADEVSVELAEGCSIAGQRIVIGSLGPRKNSEAVVLVCLPDLAAYGRAIAAAEQRLAALAGQAPLFNAKLQELATLPEVKTFLMLQKKCAAGEIANLTAEQEAQFRALGARAAPSLKRIGDLSAALQALAAQQAEAERQLATLRGERQARLATLSCQIQMVCGETVVRTRQPQADEPPLEKLSLRDLRIRLREHGAGCTQVFAGANGSFSWTWPAS